MSNQLLPCPFCGGKAEIESDDTDYPNHEAVCQDCGARCHVTGCGPDDGWEWNRRATQPAAGEPTKSKHRQEMDKLRQEREQSMAAPPAAAPVVAGEPVYQWFDGVEWRDCANTRDCFHIQASGFPIREMKGAPPVAAHGEDK